MTLLSGPIKCSKTKRSNELTDLFHKSWRFNRQVSVLALITVSLFLPALASAERALTPHVAEYKIKVSILSGKLRTEVKLTDDGYSANSVLKAAGIASLFVRGDVTERSEFAIVEDGVRPLIYHSVDKISKEDKFMDFVFDWEKNQVTGKIDGEDFVLDLEDRAHDRVSLQYELMLDLLNDSRTAEYTLVDDDEIKSLQVTYVGTETVKVPYGKFEAIKIQHRKEKSNRVTTLWCVEELDYLPVKIEQHRDDKLAVRAVLNKYKPKPLGNTTT
jgi:hypothetical protein